MASLSEQIYSPVIVIVLAILLNLNLCFAHTSGSCASEVHDDHGHSHAHHYFDRGIGNHRHDHHQHHEREMVWGKKLREELAEEEDLKSLVFGSDHRDHEHQDYSDLGLTGFGLWIHAIGCSLLVSLASLICLIIVPLIFRQGKPSKAIVDSLAVFGAGAMLGDAFPHQLPHAFGGKHMHSHDQHIDHDHHAHLGNEHSLSHSLKDLHVGLSILAGIVLFLLVENVVRYVDDISGEFNAWSHGHHHHHHKNSKKLKDGNDAHDNLQDLTVNEKESISNISSSGEVLDKVPDDCLNGETQSDAALLRKRITTTSAGEDETNVDAANGSTYIVKSTVEKGPVQSPSNLLFGYLNLFSDGVHNFTDGMALGSAFHLYGSVGGWSRTLFLLSHELPQEIGDFGIFVRAGFSVSAALFFNFLSALGFTAGGFIYIAVAGVLAEMNNGSSALKSTAIQITSLGISVALCISLVE